MDRWCHSPAPDLKEFPVIPRINPDYWSCLTSPTGFGPLPPILLPTLLSSLLFSWNTGIWSFECPSLFLPQGLCTWHFLCWEPTFPIFAWFPIIKSWSDVIKYHALENPISTTLPKIAPIVSFSFFPWQFIMYGFTYLHVSCLPN